MQNYEIRLVRLGAPSVTSARHASDYAAVRSARSMAASNDVVEIWRGKDCIYQEQSAPAKWRAAS